MNFKTLAIAVATAGLMAGSAQARYGCNVKFTNQIGDALDKDLPSATAYGTVRIQDMSGNDIATLDTDPGRIYSTNKDFVGGFDGQININNGEYIFHVHQKECQAGGPAAELVIYKTGDGYGVKEVGTNNFDIGGPGGIDDCPVCPSGHHGGCASCPTCPTCR